jgi:hypothetical protein
MSKPKTAPKPPIVREAERALDEARARLRTAAAFHCFAVAGNAKMAAQMKARLAGNRNTDLEALAARYPRFARLAALLSSIGELP